MEHRADRTEHAHTDQSRGDVDPHPASIRGQGAGFFEVVRPIDHGAPSGCTSLRARPLCLGYDGAVTSAVHRACC